MCCWYYFYAVFMLTTSCYLLRYSNILLCISEELNNSAGFVCPPEVTILQDLYQYLHSCFVELIILTFRTAFTIFVCFTYNSDLTCSNNSYNLVLIYIQKWYCSSSVFVYCLRFTCKTKFLLYISNRVSEASARIIYCSPYFLHV